MSDTEGKATTASSIDIEQLEKTLIESIKLMKRGRRQMERMRRKPGRQEYPGQNRTAA
jgi:hypothetical protein